MIIGETLKKLRKQQGYTQKQIAKYLHISQSLYAKYETQTRNPPIKIIKKLSTLYNCNEEYILYQEGTPPLNQQMFHNKKMDLQTIAKMNKICLNLQEMIKLYENQQHLKQVKE